jgi:hypothetical protein
MNKPFSRPRLHRIIELFILNNPMTWTSDHRRVHGFRSRDIAERFGCSSAHVRKIRAKMRKAGLIRNKPAE